ncbi:MAG: methylated-DNA--[protein]-cysteine S-methyltransferase [Propionibacteriaceae bacterium]|nr:methylated-DNA--[protein]-cysteine S-methyltransferase [Propionibacteriaceae bacterium]
MYRCTYNSSVGTLTLASDGPHLCGLWLDGQKYFEEKLQLRVMGPAGETDTDIVEGEAAVSASPALRDAVAWLDDYFEGKDPGESPPIALHGTAFQEEVWAQIAAIPYGRVITYGDIAQAIAAKRGDGKVVSARAVGTAVGRNPVLHHRSLPPGGWLHGQSDRVLGRYRPQGRAAATGGSRHDAPEGAHARHRAIELSCWKYDGGFP